VSAMLLTNATLDAIARGDVDLVFRRWKRPTVRTRGTLRTRIGLLDIISVDRVTVASISVDEAHRAGYATKRSLTDDLRGRTGDLYRIEVQPGGTDPLVALRQQTDLDANELDVVRMRLQRLDMASPNGPWTMSYLSLIAENAKVRAEDLAASIGSDKPPFKANVRKLKALGLTISHSPGYELSPRGRSVLVRLLDADHSAAGGAND